MACDNNNLGSNPYPEWELSPRRLVALATYVDQAKEEETSFDDLFDGPAYRTARTTFHATPHWKMPRGQTYYRGLVLYPRPGVPGVTSDHWKWLSNSDRRDCRRGHQNAPVYICRPENRRYSGFLG